MSKNKNMEYILDQIRDEAVYDNGEWLRLKLKGGIQK